MTGAAFYASPMDGGGSSHKCWDAGTFYTNSIGDEGCHDATGAVAGGQIGYRWQSSAWVFGVEAQGDWANLRGSRFSASFGAPAFGGLIDRSRIDAFGLFTGQVGYAWNSALLYVKGGAAVVSDNYSGRVTATDVAFDRAKETRWGAAVGVGL